MGLVRSLGINGYRIRDWTLLMRNVDTPLSWPAPQAVSGRNLSLSVCVLSQGCVSPSANQRPGLWPVWPIRGQYWPVSAGPGLGLTVSEYSGLPALSPVTACAALSLSAANERRVWVASWPIRGRHSPTPDTEHLTPLLLSAGWGRGRVLADFIVQ